MKKLLFSNKEVKMSKKSTLVRRARQLAYLGISSFMIAGAFAVDFESQLDQTSHFPPYELIRDTFKQRLEERKERGENSQTLEYRKAHGTPTDTEIYYNFDSPTIHVFYEGVTYKCRARYESEFTHSGASFAVEIDYAMDHSHGHQPDIKGTYLGERGLWVWPVCPAARVGLPFDTLKDSHVWWNGIGGDCFFGYRLTSKHGINDSYDVPLLIGDGPNSFTAKTLVKESKDFWQFKASNEGKQISKKNGGMYS